MSTAQQPAAADQQAAPETLDRYRWSRAFPTRWNDNDVFGHLNNTIHYAAMDTTVTAWLIGEAGHTLDADLEPAFVVSSSCRYYASAAFPDVLVVGLRADRVGGTSVSWGLGLFRESDGALLATGSFVHVFVDPASRRPVPVPAALRARIHSDLVL